MAKTSDTNLTYTQEPSFEQAIKSVIAQQWQQREEGYFKTSQKKRLFWCKLTHPSHKKSILVINGRIESCWKYQELFFDLYQQGFNVYSYDHQGQGLSDRLVNDSDIGHIGEFNDYVSDMAQMVNFFKLDEAEPCYLLAHSMGGTIATRYLQTHPEHPFKKVALSAPMYGVNVEWYLQLVAPILSQVLTAIYPKPTYAPGQQAYYAKPFEDNPLSQSHIRYEWFRNLYEENPKLKVGGASTQWVWQGLMAAKQCILLTRQIKVPLLLLQASQDRIVSNQAQIRFIKKLSKTNSGCEFKAINGAQHELLFEQDQYRNQSLDAICQFLIKEEKN